MIFYSLSSIRQTDNKLEYETRQDDIVYVKYRNCWTFAKTWWKIRQHPVANEIILMLHHLNQRRSAEICPSYLTKIMLINSTTIHNERIHYISFNGIDEPMLLSNNMDNNLHQKLNKYSLPLITYIPEYPYRVDNGILYSLECRNSRNVIFGTNAPCCAILPIEPITTIDSKLVAFHEDYPFLHLETRLLTNGIESFYLLCTLYNSMHEFYVGNRYASDILICCIMDKVTVGNVHIFAQFYSTSLQHL